MGLSKMMLAVLVGVLTSYASARTLDLSAYIYSRHTYSEPMTLHLDTSAHEFYILTARDTFRLGLGETGFRHGKTEQQLWDYLHQGGLFVIHLDSQGKPFNLTPHFRLLGGSPAECRKVERDCKKDANDRYDKQIERCDKKEGAVERDACREKAEQERGSDKQDCAKDTDRCYQAEKETASAANTSETKNAGDAMRDSFGGGGSEGVGCTMM
ncbi:MAG: hypothetical protein OXT67_01460 [Zetaproteobacteria bacterium]|nr:hypothetical protein [Zetaproteobacteria bacterium]